MKLLFTLFLIPLLNVAFAQTSVTFYDYQWQVCEASTARFYSEVEKTDSGWRRIDYYISTQKPQMVALFKDSGCKILNGNVSYYFPNGLPDAAGRKINNKEEGIYIRWHPNGMMADSANYINGKFLGSHLWWHQNGMMSDSMSRINDSTILSASWFDNGNPDNYGFYINGKKSGKWNYFHRNGNKAAIEINEAGKCVSVEYFNEDGSVLTDTTKSRRVESFKGGIKKWHDYLADKTFWPPSYELTNTDKVTVVVRFTLNEDGKVENAYVSVPFHELFDKIALDVINKSPVWSPKINHNRRVKQALAQPLTFYQE
jgi:antitoxin component YwqK of YwqJK toxin-antitoxin module